MARPRRPRPLTLGSYTVRATGDVDADGRWRWRIEWYPAGEGGAQRTRGLGRHHTADVEAEAHRVIAELGAPQAPTREQVGTWRVLLGAALAAWERDQRAGVLEASTLRGYRGHVARLQWATDGWTLPTGPRALATQAAELRDRLLGEVAASTAAVGLAVASKAWSWGVREELVAPLPWPRALGVRVQRPARYAPTGDDVRRLLRALRQHHEEARPAHRARRAEHNWPLVGVLLWWATGARIGELAALRVGDVLEDAVVLGRHQGARKTGARQVPLDEVTAAALAAYLEERRAVITLGPDDRLWPVTAGGFCGLWGRFVHPTLAELGIPAFSPHAGRAAVVDTLYALGGDPRLVADLLGHTVETALRYYRRSRTPQRRALVELRAAGGALEEAAPVRVVPFRRS